MTASSQTGKKSYFWYNVLASLRAAKLLSLEENGAYQVLLNASFIKDIQDDSKVIKGLLHINQMRWARIKSGLLRHGMIRISEDGKIEPDRSITEGMREPISAALRKLVFERDGHECVYCSSHESLCCDHVIPVIKGGMSKPDNLVAACRDCNLSKGARTPEEWRRRAN